ncbi:MAG: hypothetical protein WCS69_07860 [Ignavibacteriaceae bacterium]|jgi:hypothetical protein
MTVPGRRVTIAGNHMTVSGRRVTIAGNHMTMPGRRVKSKNMCKSDFIKKEIKPQIENKLNRLWI